MRKNGDTSVRLARAITGRQAIERTIVLPFNDTAAVIETLVARGDEIAAVLVEMIPYNIGCVLPRPEFLAAVREATSRHGCLLVFDEVVTCFRHDLGGFQKLAGVTPDLSTFAKEDAGLSDRCLVPEDDAYSLLAFLITGAEIGVVEPEFYGPRRMLEAAARLAMAMSAQASGPERTWLTTFAAGSDQAMGLARRRPEEFEEFLREASREIAAELKRRIDRADDGTNATSEIAPA